MHRDAVLFANEAFYLAFAEADLAAMDALWADRRDVICVHPGWPVLCDRAAVMESWARILANPEQPKVGVQVVQTVGLGDAALVVCYEQVAGTVMVASNVFVDRRDGPRLVMHQAGVCHRPPELSALRVPAFDA